MFRGYFLISGILIASTFFVACGNSSSSKMQNPYALLILGNSGSLEYTASGNLPESESGAACTPGTQSTPNKWGALVQSLTGSIQPFYSCTAQSRNANTVFTSEYSITSGGTAYTPYDTNYGTYHRPASGSTTNPCLITPGWLPGITVNGDGVGATPRGASGKATDFPSNAIVQRYLNDDVTAATYPNTSLTCFQQATDGVLDSTAGTINWSLMTPDTDTSTATGVATGTAVTVLETGNPFTGLWTYPSFLPTTTASDTATKVSGDLYSIGARNTAAPPWEGRLIPFDRVMSDSGGSSASSSTNANIQNAILAMRPYGDKVPIINLLNSARLYFQLDPNGPSYDNYVSSGLRKENIILITDGANAADYTCSTVICPYKDAVAIATDLYKGGPIQSSAPVSIYVIGYAVFDRDSSSTTPISCSGVDLSTCGSSGPAACCNLQKIAAAGGTEHAYFADTPTELTSVLQTVVNSIRANSGVK